MINKSIPRSLHLPLSGILLNLLLACSKPLLTQNWWRWRRSGRVWSRRSAISLSCNLGFLHCLSDHNSISHGPLLLPKRPTLYASEASHKKSDFHWFASVEFLQKQYLWSFHQNQREHWDNMLSRQHVAYWTLRSDNIWYYCNTSLHISAQ